MAYNINAQVLSLLQLPDERVTVSSFFDKICV